LYTNWDVNSRVQRIIWQIWQLMVLFLLRQLCLILQNMNEFQTKYTYLL
jgi:hypothetical protein